MPALSWAADLVALTAEDEMLPADLPGLNVSLNRARLAAFIAEFDSDSDVRDLLLLDALCVMAGVPVSSTGTVEELPTLPLRPFRLWEYAWLFKGLGIRRGGLDVLDLGGPASHLTLLAALASNRTLSIDINPEIVKAGRDCAETLQIRSLDGRVGDMRDLCAFPDNCFDVVICCSVLEHLTVDDQRASLREMARVLRPGGRIGLTFDYGPGAPGANIHLPPPHEPPGSAAEVLHRYVHSGLELMGGPVLDEPAQGGLFHDSQVQYAMASLFLGKQPLPVVQRPIPIERETSWLSGLAVSRLPRRMHDVITAHLNELASLRGCRDEMAAQSENLRAIAEERKMALQRVSNEFEMAHTSLLEKEALIRRQHASALEQDELIGSLHASMLEKESVIQSQHASMLEKDALIHSLHAAAQEKEDEIQRLNKKDLIPE